MRIMSTAKIWPGDAAPQRRKASTTGVPNQSSFSSVASPALNLTRSLTCTSGVRRSMRSAARCMPNAQATASVALGRGDHHAVSQRLYLAAPGGDDHLPQRFEQPVP